MKQLLLSLLFIAPEMGRNRVLPGKEMIDLKLKPQKSNFWCSFHFLLLSFSIVLSPPGLSAEEKEKLNIIDESLQMGLADYFFQDGDYYRAITEYKRFLFFFPQSPQNPEVMMKIVRAYHMGKRWDEAISACDALLKKFPQSSFQAEAFLINGLAFFEKKDFPQARFFFEKAQEDSSNSIIFNEAQKQIGLSYLREEEWEKAAREFRKIQDDSPLFSRGKSIADGLDRIDEVPQKSPYGAGILAAVLPGAGHVYCERYQDATVAFLLNAAFIFGMVEAFRHEEYVVGGILTFFEVGWYSGNIYSAVNGAHKYNQRKKQEYLDFLENMSLGASLQGKTHIFSLRYVF